MFLPEQWPSYYSKCKGVEVWDLDGNKYIDMTICGVGACVLGYADPDVDTAVIEVVKVGNMCTLKVPEEVELAEDTTPTIDVILHALSFFEKKAINFDYLALLKPTSPLRDESDIDNSIELLIDNENIAERVVGADEILLEHPFIAKSIDKNGFVKLFIRKWNISYKKAKFT